MELHDHNSIMLPQFCCITRCKRIQLCYRNPTMTGNCITLLEFHYAPGILLRFQNFVTRCNGILLYYMNSTIRVTPPDVTESSYIIGIPLC